MSVTPVGARTRDLHPTRARTGPPVDLSSFIGRDAEIHELHRLISESRLLTLTGAGGSGKSRLARQVAGSAADALGVGLAWVELAGMEEPALLARHVADACGLREEVRDGHPGVLAELLRGRALLLVLDNCEHLVEACASLADAVLGVCPDLRIVATSREALGIAGERAWLVPPLVLAAESSGDARSIGASEAVALFCERARHTASSWTLTDDNAGVVAEICRRLDGMPLAIELAAARVKVLSPEQIRDRLDDAFRLLTSGGRTSLPRHRTLRATMDWSHDLLPDDARVLLRRLSVFRAGFSLDAVEAVGGGEPLDPLEVLETLARLVDRSLVVVREQDGQTRYALLETVRQYAAEKLRDSGEQEVLRARHATWMSGLVRSAEPHLIRSERPAWVARLLSEIDNLREALAWTHTGAPDLHVDLVGRMWWLWFSTQHWNEAARWIVDALALPEAARPGLERARVLFAAGALSALRGEGANARGLLEEAAALAAAAGDGRLEAYSLNYLGMTWAGQSDARGRAPCERAAAWFEADGDLYGLRLALLLLGSSAIAEGDLDRAEAMNLEGVQAARRFGLDRELAVSLQNLAVVYLSRGEVHRAEPVVREGLAASRRDPSYYFIGIGLQYMAEILGQKGEALEAARILGASEAARERVGARPFEIDRVRLEAALPGFEAMAGVEAFAKARAEGRLLMPLEAIDRVLGDLPRPGTEQPHPVRDSAPPEEPYVAAATMESAESLRVQALGSFHVEIGARAIGPDAWAYVKPRELLVLLLLHPRGRTRDQTTEALWPEAVGRQATNSFHVTAHHLRKALGRPEWLERDGDRYRIAPSVDRWFDAEVFETSLGEILRQRGATGRTEGPPATANGGPGGGAPARAEALRSALALYRGDLLEGEPVGSWLEDHRDRLRRLHVDGLIALGKTLEAESRWSEAAELYSSAVSRESLNEEVHRRLMTCWAQGGQRSRALQHYDYVERLLLEALDAQPEPATRSLAEALRAG